ncbi:hypothetical protein LguiA_021930 [Lonicera macranthoides]
MPVLPIPRKIMQMVYPSQLKPFSENFEEMSMHSSSTSSVNAVKEALDEIGWLVESKMNCSYAPEEI